MTIQVEVSDWRGKRVVALADYLQPDSNSDGGELERLRSDVRECQEVIGNLLATLVHCGVVSLEGAELIAQRYGNAKIVK